MIADIEVKPQVFFWGVDNRVDKIGREQKKKKKIGENIHHRFYGRECTVAETFDYNIMLDEEYRVYNNKKKPK